jgi:hypothetical protein
MTADERSGPDAPEDVGNAERDSLGTARPAAPAAEEPIAPDLRDTWNVEEKTWNRVQASVDPFDDIADEDVQDDRTSYRERSGI